MALTIKQIAAGQLPNNQGGSSPYPTLSPVVATAKAQIIKTMRFYNTHASTAITLTLYAYSANTSPFTGTTEKFIAKVSIAAGDKYVDTAELTLEATQQLRYSTSATGGPIDFVISGVERDQ